MHERLNRNNGNLTLKIIGKVTSITVLQQNKNISIHSLSDKKNTINATKIDKHIQAAVHIQPYVNVFSNKLNCDTSYNSNYDQLDFSYRYQ